MQNDRLEARRLAWDGCLNVRDLGGLPADKGVTRWRAVIRADTLSRLTAQGQQSLLAYGARAIIDLRSISEAQAEPYQLPVAPVSERALAYYHLPLAAEDARTRSLIAASRSRAAVYAITLDHAAARVVSALRAVSAAPPGGVVIHCHSGKDRTGLVAALLLRLAGVDEQLIAADYALSQGRAAAGNPPRRPLHGQEPPWYAQVATEAVILAVLSHLDSRYGGVAPYLQTFGMTGAELDRLRHRLCQHEPEPACG